MKFWTGFTDTSEDTVIELPGSITHGEFCDYAGTTERKFTDQPLRHFP